MTTRRRFLALSTAAIVAPLAAPAIIRDAWAQGAWPAKPIRAVCPFQAGSTVDVWAA